MIEYIVVKSIKELNVADPHLIVFLLREYFVDAPSDINAFFIVNNMEEVSEKVALLDEDPLLIQELI